MAGQELGWSSRDVEKLFKFANELMASSFFS